MTASELGKRGHDGEVTPLQAPPVMPPGPVPMAARSAPVMSQAPWYHGACGAATNPAVAHNLPPAQPVLGQPAMLPPNASEGPGEYTSNAHKKQLHNMIKCAAPAPHSALVP